MAKHSEHAKHIRACLSKHTRVCARVHAHTQARAPALINVTTPNAAGGGKTSQRSTFTSSLPDAAGDGVGGWKVPDRGGGEMGGWAGTNLVHSAVVEAH